MAADAVRAFVEKVVILIILEGAVALKAACLDSASGRRLSAAVDGGVKTRVAMLARGAAPQVVLAAAVALT